MKNQSYIDLKGKRFGRLTVKEKVVNLNKKNRTARWLCICDCGGEKTVRADTLKGGHCLSCGCLKKEQDRKNLTQNHSHLQSGSRIYGIWQGMKRRCQNTKEKKYHRYGGRGIKVCQEWEESFQSFYNWALENGYKEDLTLERKNNDGNYEPSNCTWATVKEQCNNRCTNIVVEVEGETLNLQELSGKYGINYSLIHSRYSRGDRGNALIRPLHSEREKVRGERNNNNKITEEAAKKIKHKLKTGEIATKIARELNISKHIVYSIKREKTWKWI